MAVYGEFLVLSQRGNSVDANGNPAQNLLIHLDLGEVLESIYTDLSVGELELRGTRSYELGELPVERDGVTHEVKINFTDLDAVTGDPHQRLVFTAAGEGPDGSPVAERHCRIGGGRHRGRRGTSCPLRRWQIAASSSKGWTRTTTLRSAASICCWSRTQTIRMSRHRCSRRGCCRETTRRMRAAGSASRICDPPADVRIVTAHRRHSPRSRRQRHDTCTPAFP